MKIIKKSRDYLFKIDSNDQKCVDLFYIVRKNKTNFQFCL